MQISSVFGIISLNFSVVHDKRSRSTKLWFHIVKAMHATGLSAKAVEQPQMWLCLGLGAKSALFYTDELLIYLIIKKYNCSITISFFIKKSSVALKLVVASIRFVPTNATKIEYCKFLKHMISQFLVKL